MKSNVSAIITNYNYAGYLAAAVESAISQSSSLAEIVIVDDGSRDSSREVIENLTAIYSGRVIALFQQNGGQAAAINAGFAHCTGDIICMLDADDIWDGNKVESVIAAFKVCPEASMVMHRYRTIDTDGEVISLNGSGAFPGGDLDRLMVDTGGMWVFAATSGLSLRRSTLEQILPIPSEKWRLCADGAIAFPSAFLGKVISLDAVLGSYRVHGSNNHFNAGLNPDKVQADVEMTNEYINDFLIRIGRPEKVNLIRNLQYRRDRFYRHGGSLGEAIAIARLIATWPMYRGPIERARYLARFLLRAYGPRSLSQPLVTT